MASRPRRARASVKRYTEDPIALEGDDESFAVPESRSDDGDFDAQAEAARIQDDDDDPEADPSDDEPQDEADGTGPKGTSAPPKRQRNPGAGMIQSRKGFHDIPHYPLETRIVTRVYAGPLRRYARYSALRDAMYGPEYQRIKIIWDLDNRWRDYPLLPPKLPPEDPQGITPSPWLPAGLEAEQQQRAFLWYDNYKVGSPDIQRTHTIHLDAPEPRLPEAKGDMVLLLGPWNKQGEYRLGPRSGLLLNPLDVPIENPETSPEKAQGWAFDVGGIPLALAWAPASQRTSQVLAVASIPFSDQEPIQTQVIANPPEKPNTTGTIQLWEFPSDAPAHGQASPGRSAPRLITASFFDWGRPKRLQWCPVPLDTSGIYGLLAVLCGDGKARVIEFKSFDDTVERPYGTSHPFPFGSHANSAERIESPIVTLGVSNDYNVNVTCLTWVNTNRIALGHSDGTVTLWSIFPQRMLQRVPVHSNYVIDICSGYPSNPYLVASIPVGGCATLTDLSQPSSELTYFPVPAISFQPNMLCWNELMQGFMALYPSSTPTTTVAFLHHRYFCQARSTITGPNSVTCVSAGATHPFILVGSADGSVYACNALQKLFRQKGEPLQKLKIFEHESRPLDQEDEDDPRGAARILQGFLPEVNDDPRTEKRKEIDRKKRLAAQARKKEAGKKKAKSKKAGEEEEAADREAEIDDRLASRAITHEPLTRITTIAWNPNVKFSCWAACAMGSGLVKVMDLGVEG
ncbi:WD40-repeat-containing domain protein [Immersiella caudata]|uniref:WD40-repeat-containing domain protein n=1 Tax=Immersiella caudata TaxID=314043 RepID=A0AA40C0Z6_9PEZI|nr:WD40-repeat-containing domain protein [Immersiella caudata]